MKKIYKILIALGLLIVVIVLVMFLKKNEQVFISPINVVNNNDLSGVENADKFHLVSTKEWSLSLLGGINNDGLADTSANPYFKADGQAIFFKSDPSSHGEIIKNNPNKIYTLEVYTSEPDMAVSLWDLKEKKVYIVAQCGTACGFSGAYWISNLKFVVYGIARGYGEGESISDDSRFVNVYNLADMTVANYSDK